MGLSDRDIVSLMGIHGLGTAVVANSGYSGKWGASQTLFNGTYFHDLFGQVWTPITNVSTGPYHGVLPNGQHQYTDPSTNHFFMLPCDLALSVDPSWYLIGLSYANNWAYWYADFAPAWTKLMNLGLTGNSYIPTPAASLSPSTPAITVVHTDAAKIQLLSWVGLSLATLLCVL